MSLVADYGTSSESGGDSDTDLSENAEINNEDAGVKGGAEKLPRPDFGCSSTSVFSNPFMEAENAKKAILEKHVKMVPSKEDTRLINGKKICWNYRKGKCRFGHKCQFAHDSDLHKNEDATDHRTQPTIAYQNTSAQREFIPADTVVRNKKKRCGLTQGLVPGNKVMKMFEEQQGKERPWTSHS